MDGIPKGNPMMTSRGCGFLAAWVCAWALTVAGCATTPYRYGVTPPSGIVTADMLRPGEPQFERGKPQPLIDGIGWLVGIPSKIILWDIRADNHSISEETEAALRRYLELNDLDQVKVRLNQYAPLDEWRRLTRNRAVGWGWRYTFGVFSWLHYTLLPGRIFGGDHYNPYTDTISLYSNIPAVALHEGGHAKDFAGRRWRGTYAVAYLLPFFALYPEALATGDAIGYLRDQQDAEGEREAYHVLYPAYATYVGGNLASHIVKFSWTYYAAVIPGHIVGRWKGSTVPRRAPDGGAEGHRWNGGDEAKNLEPAHLGSVP